MKGSYFVEINTKRINYKFTINRNITIIRGDSATGKTTLSDLIKEYKNSDYIKLVSKVDCEYLDDRDWLYRINEYKNTIFFVDEESDFVLTKEFAREISKGNDNYFVIITRDNLPYLNYSYKEIYEIHNSGKYNYLVRKYDFKDDIMNLSKLKFIDIESIITEDSKSGYELLKELYKTSEVISLEGKSKIYKYVKNKHKMILFVDGAAFGNEIDRLMLVFENDNILYIPESIEYIILNSYIFDNKVNNIINNLPQCIRPDITDYNKEVLDWC